MDLYQVGNNTPNEGNLTGRSSQPTVKNEHKIEFFNKMLKIGFKVLKCIAKNKYFIK